MPADVAVAPGRGIVESRSSTPGAAPDAVPGVAARRAWSADGADGDGDGDGALALSRQRHADGAQLFGLIGVADDGTGDDISAEAASADGYAQRAMHAVGGSLADE